MGYRSASKSVYWARYQLIWGPKYRTRIVVGSVETRLKEVIAELGAEVIELEVMPDHVHLLVEVPPRVPLSKLVQLLKARSSRLLRAEFPRPARMRGLWSPSWFVSTVGRAPLAMVGRYVENLQAVA